MFTKLILYLNFNTALSLIFHFTSARYYFLVTVFLAWCFFSELATAKPLALYCYFRNISFHFLSSNAIVQQSSNINWHWMTTCFVKRVNFHTTLRVSWNHLNVPMNAWTKSRISVVTIFPLIGTELWNILYICIIQGWVKTKYL